MLEAGLIASRFIHYAAVLTLFGAALYPLYSFREGLAVGGAALVPALRRLFAGAALLAFLGGVGWFVFTTAAMAGDMALVFDLETLRTMVLATDFGPLWLIRLVFLMLVVAFLPAWPSSRASLYLLPICAALLLASLAFTGHVRATTGLSRIAHTMSDAVHLLTAGLWLGGLLPLSILVVQAVGGSEAAIGIGEVLTRFSRTATAAVALLVLTGLVNGWFLVGSLRALVETTYGQLLLVKVALFLLMALLASLNRFVVTPRLAVLSGGERTTLLRRLHLQVFCEQVLGCVVLAIVSLLGTLEPGIVG
jgi:putative copper resistance protein D